MGYNDAASTTEDTAIDTALLETLLTNAPVGFAFFDHALRFGRINAALAGMNGVPAEAHIGRTVSEVLPRQSPHVARALRHVLRTGKARINMEVSGETPAAPGETRHWLSSYYPVRGQGGALLGVGAIVSEITERRRTELEREAALHALREETEIVETVSRIGQMLSAELDLENLVQAVTDAATTLSGAQFGAFFYNARNESGDAYLLYTISGAPREAFSRFPMPRSTEIFAPTFRGEGVVRLDDVRTDPRFGKNAPYHGMPPGHLPVASYLAVPVRSRSGEVIGGLFFGHEKTGVFTERAERMVLGLAAQAAIAMDNARLFLKAQQEIEERRRAEEALRRSELQTRVFLRDVLASVTEGRLCLCDGPEDLPAPLPAAGEPLALTARTIALLRQQVKTIAQKHGILDERWQDLETAVGEAAMNAVVHAGGGEARVCASPAGDLQVWVEDHGRGIAVNALHRATLERGFTTAGSLGHGFWIMLRTADRLWLLTGPEGTTVVLEQNRVPPAPTWIAPVAPL